MQAGRFRVSDSPFRVGLRRGQSQPNRSHQLSIRAKITDDDFRAGRHPVLLQNVLGSVAQWNVNADAST